MSKYLEGSESLKVYLPTMVLEIRGTSGYVSVDATGQEWLYLCDGKVHLTATNPLTGEVASKDVYEGHKVSVRYYEEQTEERGSVEFVVENMSEQDLPHPLIRELALDKVLLRRVVIATGFSEEQLVKMAQQLENGEPLEESEEETIEEETLEEEEPEDEEVEEEEQEEEETPEEDTRQTTTRRQRTQQAQEQPQEDLPALLLRIMPRITSATTTSRIATITMFAIFAESQAIINYPPLRAF